MDAEPVGLEFCGGSLLAEPQVPHVEGTRSHAHGGTRACFSDVTTPDVREDTDVAWRGWAPWGSNPRPAD